MWPTSDEFRAILNSSNRKWRSKVEVLYAGELRVELDVMLDGKISLDDVAVRRQCDLTIVDADGLLTPVTAHDLLAPKGTELRPSRGLVLSDGTVEWIPLGVFGVVEPEISAEYGGGTRIKLKGYDRVDAMRVRRFPAPYSIRKGTPTTTALANIVTSRLDVPTRITETGSTTPETIFDALSDPWDAVRDLASADTLTAYFDPLGNFTTGPDVDVETGVSYTTGVDSLLIATSRSFDSSKTYSGVVVTGEHPDETPIRVELWDTDPNSPTYADGPFGRRPYGFSSSLITTEAQALLSAQTILKRVTRIPQTATLTTVGHIGHDIGDIVTVDDARTRTSGRWRIYGGGVPLRPGTNSWKLEEIDIA